MLTLQICPTCCGICRRRGACCLCGRLGLSRGRSSCWGSIKRGRLGWRWCRPLRGRWRCWGRTIRSSRKAWKGGRLIEKMHQSKLESFKRQCKGLIGGGGVLGVLLSSLFFLMRLSLGGKVFPPSIVVNCLLLSAFLFVLHKAHLKKVGHGLHSFR